MATNDQGHIIEALKDENYMYVWENIKWVGYKQVTDIEERFAIFCKIVEDFDYVINNNFIHWYKTQLNYYKLDNNDSTFYVTTNKNLIKKLQAEHSNPTECGGKQHMLRELKQWKN